MQYTIALFAELLFVDIGFRILEKFKVEELACRGTQVLDCEPVFLMELAELRRLCGHSLTPTSCCRAPEYNEEIGGHKRSLHLTRNPVHKNIKTGLPLKTSATDLDIDDWDDAKLNKFIELAWARGWSIGVNKAKGFIHIDRRELAGLAQKRFEY